MAFSFVDLKKIETAVDEKTGELKSIRLLCTELAPRSFGINLIKQPASIRAELQRYIDSKTPVMLPVKEGKTSDGQAYFSLEPGQIIPVSLDYVKTLQAQEQIPVSQTVTVEPVKTEQPKADLKSLMANR
jgi:hypothetical protein